MILIDTKMPATCSQCWNCDKDANGWYCVIQMHYVEKTYETSRPEWCPLITLPPHGDLIDKNALIKQLEGLLKYSMPDSHTAQRTREMIVELGVAPTIIPAEEGET